jgi:dTMP kinase
MIERGKFIVIEGVDGSGKATQFNLLHKRLKRFKKRILIADFPRYYDSIWGKLVGEFLTGKYGKFDEISPHLAVLTYMIDEYTWSRDIGRPFIEKGGVILSNRYFTSNVHQVAKLKTRAQKVFRDWLWPAGYESFGILKPDLVVFLDVPPEVCKRLNLKKQKRIYLGEKRQDLAELDWKHQVAAYKEYLRTVRFNRNWVKINCTTRGMIDSVESIHKRVWAVASKLLRS